jgi:tetratricopeptide (TPR) repeat protein
VEGLPRWPLLAAGRRFQNEAYEEQGESRLMVHPMIAPVGQVTAEDVLEAVRLVHDELATPSLMLHDHPPAGLLGDLTASELRIFLTEGGEVPSEEVFATLRAHHVFESVLERLRDGHDDLLAPCDPHVVVDQATAQVFPCLGAWVQQSPSASMSEGPGGVGIDRGTIPTDLCADCVCASSLSVGGDLELGGRGEEAREVCFGIGVALSRRGRHDRAAELAERAVELADSDSHRTRALVHLGLCRLECGMLAAADEALEKAALGGADPGLVAYHRGRVQMAWPDEIEALERFEEARAAGSFEVSDDDLHLQMALAHIRLAEFDDARPHVELADGPGRRATTCFLRGVCDLNQGAVEAALGHFSESLEHRPDMEDLPRVLLYHANCLKELERFEEAIEPLRRAVMLEPNELAHHNLLGFCYYKLERHGEAVDCFRRAVEIDPTSGIDWANLGSNLRDLSRSDEAIAAYERALELDPTLGFAADSLARLRPSGASDVEH